LRDFQTSEFQKIVEKHQASHRWARDQIEMKQLQPPSQDDKMKNGPKSRAREGIATPVIALKRETNMKSEKF
jgi:hypothetical protein